MVFTVPVRIGEGCASRRTVLRLAVGTALGAATALGLDGGAADGTQPEWVSGPDPLSAFRKSTLRLAGQYEATISAQPTLADRLGPLYDDHRAHAAALTRELALPADRSPAALEGTSTDGSGQPTEALAALLAAEKAAAQEAADACLTAPDWRAPLLGSIAACRASHVEALINASPQLKPGDFWLRPHPTPLPEGR
jgi:hypothetical protein